MDFQTHQHEARQSTTKLILLFGAGMVSIMVVIALVVTLILTYASEETEREIDPVPVVMISLIVTVAGVGGSAMTKAAQIRGGGGAYIAISMGGRPIDFNTLDPAEKQLSNIVEEIAIASGLPVPGVFILDNEQGINAFAAGWTADNAAIGVTRGALQHLNRAELQGVIAHEFAHIRNGDTKIKTRIIAWVFGMAAITVLGRLILETMWYAPRRRRSRSSSSSDEADAIAVALTLLAFALIAIGSLGTLFAKLIQASVSRQRELLADASAVQFTRDPDGLGSALSKIGGMSDTNRIRSAHAVEAGHLFFSSPLTSRFATHPPLKARIARLVPNWDGNFAVPKPPKPRKSIQEGAAAPGWGFGGHEHAGLPGVSVPGTEALPFDPVILMGGALASEAGAGRTDGQSVTSHPPAGHVPNGSAAPAADGSQGFQAPTFDGPTEEHIAYARQLLARIPEDTQNYLHTRGGAVAAMLGLLVSTEPSRRPQDLALAAAATGLDPSYIDQASDVIARLDRPLQLPAIDIALHSIREIPWDFQEALRETILAIESSRPDQDLFRWMLRRVLIRHLEDQHDTGRARHITPFDHLRDDVKIVFTAIAWFNSAGKEWAPSSYAAGLAAAGMPDEPVQPEQSLSVDKVDDALERLAHLDVPGRQRFVGAALSIVDHDKTTTADEAELIRVIADAVRLPMPPLLPV